MKQHLAEGDVVLVRFVVGKITGDYTPLIFGTGDDAQTFMIKDTSAVWRNVTDEVKFDGAAQ